MEDLPDEKQSCRLRLKERLAAQKKGSVSLEGEVSHDEPAFASTKTHRPLRERDIERAFAGFHGKACPRGD
jgi:hypothetical protein